MTLATRCPNCETAFRVVRDQLRVSEGWVRCGQCDKVFDASAYLVDWPDSSTAGSTNSSDRTNTKTSAGAASSDTQSEGSGDRALLTTQAAPEPAVTGVFEPGDLRSTQGTSVAAEGGRSLPSIATPSIDVAERQIQETYKAPTPQTPSSDAPSLLFSTSRIEVDEDTATSDVPHFVKQAQANERSGLWSRLLWGSTCLAALLVLVGQWVLHERNTVSAQWPLAQPWLQQICQQLGCRVDAPRADLDDLSVEATTFNRVRGNTYRLSLALRNRSEVPVATPLIELTLTDQQDQVIARKVLLPSQWAGGTAVMRPREDVNGAVAFSTTLDRVAGYRVLAFYP